jgi:hypothetical protein
MLFFAWKTFRITLTNCLEISSSYIFFGFLIKFSEINQRASHIFPKYAISLGPLENLNSIIETLESVLKISTTIEQPEWNTFYVPPPVTAVASTTPAATNAAAPTASPSSSYPHTYVNQYGQITYAPPTQEYYQQTGYHPQYHVKMQYPSGTPVSGQSYPHYYQACLSISIVNDCE